MNRTYEQLRGHREAILVVGDHTILPILLETIRTDYMEPTKIEALVLENEYGRNMMRDFRYKMRRLFGSFNPGFLPFVEKQNPKIERVIFNDPATIVIWSDKTKTVVKCQTGDTYDKEKGLALCIAKKYFGNKGNFNEVFKKWIPEEKEIEVNQQAFSNLGTVLAKAFNMKSEI